MKPTELVAAGRLVEEKWRPLLTEATRRSALIGIRRMRGRPIDDLLPAVKYGDLRDLVGKELGISGSLYERAKRVVEAAEAEPEKHGDLLAILDGRTVYEAFMTLKARRRAEKDGAPAPTIGVDQRALYATPRHAVHHRARRNRGDEEMGRSLEMLATVMRSIVSVDLNGSTPEMRAAWKKQLLDIRRKFPLSIRRLS